jgi:hypothetical protein
MTTKDEALALALKALENHDGNYAQSNESVARVVAALTAIEQAITPETGNAANPEASAITAGNGQQAQEPVQFLANGVRFKLVNCGPNASGFVGFPKELAGRWVALVAAEDDCHLRLSAPKQAEPVQPSSQKTIALALEGAELHDYNAPEYIISAELIRLNKALSGAPTPPEAKA